MSDSGGILAYEDRVIAFYRFNFWLYFVISNLF